MKLQFPVYLLGGDFCTDVLGSRRPYLKSKLDECEYLFVFTSVANAQQFMANRIKNPEGLGVIETQKDELLQILENEVGRVVQKIVIDFDSEYRMTIEQVIGDLRGS